MKVDIARKKQDRSGQMKTAKNPKDIRYKSNTIMQY